jgi:hypothetical protein
MGKEIKKEQSRNFLEQADNITILCKGREDEIFNKDAHVKVTGGGSGRRCGGQGDLLSGAAATFLTWALQQDELSQLPVRQPPGHRIVRGLQARQSLQRESFRQVRQEHDLYGHDPGDTSSFC